MTETTTVQWEVHLNNDEIADSGEFGINYCSNPDKFYEELSEESEEVWDKEQIIVESINERAHSRGYVILAEKTLYWRIK